MPTRLALKRAPAQVEVCDIVAELADVAWQREALVVFERHVAALGLHADEREREFACAKSASQFVIGFSIRFCVV